MNEIRPVGNLLVTGNLFHVQHGPAYTGQMENRELLSLLREYVSYDPVSGFLTWRKADERRILDDRCERLSGRGYLDLGLPGGHRLQAHRAAWGLTYGEMPNGPLDHINRVRTDNRLANLRVVTHSQNNFNCGPRPTNKSGFRGVSWWAYVGKWRAVISVDGKQKYLGAYDTKEEAATAYARAAATYFGDLTPPGEQGLTAEQSDVLSGLHRRGSAITISAGEIEIALGLGRQVLAMRLKRGWPLAQALLTPPGSGKRRSKL